MFKKIFSAVMAIAMSVIFTTSAFAAQPTNIKSVVRVYTTSAEGPLASSYIAPGTTTTTTKGKPTAHAETYVSTLKYMDLGTPYVAPIYTEKYVHEMHLSCIGTAYIAPAPESAK